MLNRNTLKRAGAMAMAAVMAAASVPVFAENGIAEEEIRQTLLSSVDETDYPKGMFDFLTPRMETSEDIREAEFAVVRRGNTDQAASVVFKAIDMTARYGEDYVLKISGAASGKALPANTKADSLYYGGGPSDGNASQTEDPQSALGKDMRSAKAILTGTKTEYTNWREADADDVSALSQAYEEMYRQFDGVEYTLEFKAGEYMKKIKFDVIDDSDSEDDEQVLFVLLDPVNGDVSENPTGFMNIKDNEEPEEITFAFTEAEVSVERENLSAELTVQRKTGISRYATATVSSAEGTAPEGEFYDGFAVELTFVPGQQYRKIEIPIKKHPLLEDVSFSVYIDGSDEAATVNIRCLGSSAEEAADGDAALMANDPWTRTATVKLEPTSQQGLVETGGSDDYYFLPISSYNRTSSVTSELDLSMVGKLSVTSEEASQGTWFDTRWWLFGWHGSSGYYDDMDNVISVGGNVKASHHGKYGTTTNTFTLTDRERSSGSVTFSTSVFGYNQKAYGIFSRDVKLHYLPIEVQTGFWDDDAMIQRKVYTSPTDFENEGEPFLAGRLKFKGESDVTGSKFFYNDDTVSLEVTDMPEEFLDGVYLWGIKFETVSGADKKFYYYKGTEFSIKDLYSGMLKDVDGKPIGSVARLSVTHDGESFPCYRIFPVYKQKTAFTTIKIDESKSSFAPGTFKNEETVRTGLLDKLRIFVSDRGNDIVSGFDGSCVNDGAAKVTSDEIERSLADMSTGAANDFYRDFSPAYNTASDWEKISANLDSPLGGELLFSPPKTHNVLEAIYQKPSITVAVNPRSVNADDQGKGFAVYLGNEDGNHKAEYKGPDENGLLRGDEIVVSPYKAGSAYKLIGSFNDDSETDFKFQWQDFTGDTNRDGILSDSEIKALGQSYSVINKGVYAGDTFDYVPSVTGNVLLYFNIVPKPKNSALISNTLSGRVQLETSTVIENSKPRPQKTRIPIAGATVTAGGLVDTTDENGSWSLTSSNFEPGETYTSALVYGGKVYSGDVTVNRSAVEFIVDEYNTFNVRDFNAYRINGTSLDPIDDFAISNEDKRHLYSFKIDELLPGTATVGKVDVERHSKDGVLKKTYTAVLNEDSHNYEIKDPELLEKNKNNPDAYNYSFNPATEHVAPGDYLVIRIHDQRGLDYIPHNVGMEYKPKLSVINIINSFRSPVNNVIDFMGDVDAIFDLGLVVGLDSAATDALESAGLVRTEDNNDRIISYGFKTSFSKNYAGPQGKGSVSNSEAVKLEAEKLDSVSKLADSDKTSDQKADDDKLKDNASDIAKEAVDEDDKNGKRKVGITSDLSADLNVALELVMGYDQKENRYYFKNFVITGYVNGSASAKAEYMTPIGMPVFVKGDLSGDISAMMAVEPFYKNPGAPDYLYMDDQGTIDLTKLGTSSVNRRLSIYGRLIVRPSVKLSVGTAIYSDKIAAVSLDGKADFDMVFTSAGEGAGNVTLSANLVLDILGGLVQKNWEIAKKKFDMFATGSLASLLDTGEDYRYDVITPEDTDKKLYLANRGDWDPAVAVTLADDGRHRERELQAGAYPYAAPRILDLGAGQHLMLFLNSDERGTQLNYSLYQDGAWSWPRPVDRKSVSDANLKVFDLNDSFLVVWSSEEAGIDTDDVATRLNSRNIKCAFFDKKSLTFGQIQSVTKTTSSDVYGDDFASVAYREENGKKDLVISYTKSLYQETGGELTVGDVLNPNSLIAYRLYDFEKNRWAEEYTGESLSALESALSPEEARVFGNDWYGQRFVDISKYVYVDETNLLIEDGSLPYDGLWQREPKSSEIEIKTLSADPKILENETIGCGDFAVSAYLVDLDGDEKTTEDSDIFIQLYSFDSQKVYPAMRLTNDALSQSHLKMISAPDGRWLYYVSGDNIAAVNISSIVDNLVSAKAKDDTEVFLINKYYPVYSGEETVVSGSKENPFTEYTVRCDGNNVYILWCEDSIRVKDGIDPSSSEASLPENHYSERQIYLTMKTFKWLERTLTDESGNPLRYPEKDEDGKLIDWNTTEDINGEKGRVVAGDPIVERLCQGTWTTPVQLTDDLGANFSQVDCLTAGNGILRMVYLKGMSSITEISGVDVAAENRDDRSLVCSDFDIDMPAFRVSITNSDSIFSGRGNTDVEISVKNMSPLPSKSTRINLFMEKDGESVLIGSVDTGVLTGGEQTTVRIPWSVPDILEGTTLAARAIQGSIICGQDRKELENLSKFEITHVSHEMTSRNRARFTVEVKNISSENAYGEVVYVGSEGILASSDEFDLMVGETRIVTVDGYMPDSSFKESRDGTDIVETADVRIISNGGIAAYSVERRAPEELARLMKKPVTITDRSGTTAYEGKITMKDGDMLTLRGRFEGEDQSNYPRIELIPENIDILSETNGVITAKSVGTTKLKAVLSPAADVFVTNSGEKMSYRDIYNTLPSALIRTVELEVEVTEAPKPVLKSATALPEGDELRVSVEYENVPPSAEFIAVSYGADGKQLGIARIDNGSALLPAKGTKRVKIFVWKSFETMLPLCESLEISL